MEDMLLKRKNIVLVFFKYLIVFVLDMNKIVI